MEGERNRQSINERLKQSEKNLTVVYTTILESHLQFSSILKNSSEDNMTKQFEIMNLKRRNEGGNHSANHLPLPVFEPPNTPHEFSEMWFDILRKRREEIPMQVKDGNLLSYN